MTGSLQIKNNKYYIVLNTYEKGKRKIKWINTDLSVAQLDSASDSDSEGREFESPRAGQKRPVTMCRGSINNE